MKIKLLYATLALCCSLTLFSQQNTCANPIAITLPYQTSNSTANFGNTYSTVQGIGCGAVPSTTNYFGGNDVFYSFTAPTTGLISVSMTPSASNSSIFVYNACPSSGSACIAGVANTTANVRNFNFNATAGQTYLIALSSATSVPSYSYNLIIQDQFCDTNAIPTNLTAVNTTLTSSTLSWSSDGTDSLWEVVVQPQGGTIPQATDERSFTQTNSLTATGLTAGTSYQYWVRGYCSSWAYSAWAGPFAFNTPLCVAADKCNYTFRLTDSANNGWNGAAMQVKQNGQIVASTSGAPTFGPTYVAGAGPVDVSFALCKDQPFEVFWVTAGTQPQQCAFSILNSFGQTIFTKPATVGSAGSTVYSGTVNCTAPVCDVVVPIALNASDILLTSATLNWTAAMTSSWDIYLVPAGSPGPNAETVPTYNDVTTNGFPVTGLIQSTEYQFYLRTNCGTAPTAWSAAGSFTTTTSCYKPTQVNISGISTTEATVNWTNGLPSDTNWEILLVPGLGAPAPGDNPSTANGAVLVNTSIPSSYYFSNLQTGTIYNCYMRTVCSAEEKSQWTAPVTFNTIICDQANKCSYRFVLTDSGSNGWNGAKLLVRQNGIVIATLGTQISTGGPTSVAVALCTNTPFDVYWNVAGTADNEIGLSIENPFSDTIYTLAPGTSSQGQVVYSGTADCAAPACPKPLSLTSANTTQTGTQLSWTAAGSETQWEVCVLPSGTTPPVNGTPVTGTGNFHVSNTNTAYAVSGLLPGTTYNFYVRAICSATSQSTWTLSASGSFMAGVFTTKPLNDEPAQAISVTPSPTWSCGAYASGNMRGATPTALSTFSGTFCQYGSNDVWFVFTATNPRHVIDIKNLSPANSLNYSLFSGNPQNLNLMYCNGSSASLTPNLVVGSQYYIRVYRASSISVSLNPTFDLCVSTPPSSAVNDECSNAIVASVNSGAICDTVTAGSLTGATASAVTPACQGSADDDVWFTFTALSASQIISLTDIVGTSTSLNFALYSGSCGALGTSTCSNLGTLTKNDFIPGQQYRLRVWSTAATPQAVAFNLCIRAASSCYTAEPFCGSSPDDPYVFSNVTSLPGNSEVACLASIPNPAYYYMRVGETGPLSFQIMQSDSFDSLGNPVGTPRDVDFVAWGPFTSPNACSQIAMADCPSCPFSNLPNTGFYPFGNIVDCSYSSSATETLSIPNAQAGEYYIVLITNFSNQPGYIKLSQTNYYDASAGHTYCVDKIQLVAFIDTNGNGTKDANEVNASVGNFIFQKNNTGPVSSVYSPVGTYNVYNTATTDTFDFSYQVDPEWASYFSAASTNYNDVSIVAGNGAQVYYFPLTTLQTYTDLAVSLTPIGSPRPGLPFTVQVMLKNKGITPVSGTLTFAKDSSVSISAVSINGAILVPGGFTYDFTGLLPFETRTITVTLIVPALPTVSLGQLVTQSVGLSFAGNDVHPSDSTATLTQTITGSYDPNDKMEAHGHEVNLADFGTTGYLYYIIRFQNTGNAEAFHVKVKDLLSAQLDAASVRMVASSHNYVLERVGSQLTWDFDNIQLPGIGTSEALSKGYVTFMVRPLANYNTGDTIDNGAEIYFDTNPAIYTNVFQTLFTGLLSAPSFNDKGLLLYPNPANSMVTVSLGQQGATLKKVLVYDMVGKLVKAYDNLQAAEATLDVSGLSKGMYLTEISTSDDFKVVRKLMIK